jgi:L-fuconolactonase
MAKSRSVPATSIPALIDSHHHLWRRRDLVPRGILAAGYLDRDVLWADLWRVADGLDLRATVVVQVRDDLEEVGFVEEVAAEHPRLAAMVPWAPLEREDAAAVLERLRRRPLVRGVRRSTQEEPDPEFILRPGYVAGVRRLGEVGLLCELCVRHEQLGAVPRLADACPETTIVVQHLGKPNMAGAPPARWLRWIEELGARPNVWIKLSPVVHTAEDRAFTAEVQAPFIRHALACFGPDRAVFGSNWPVSEAVVGYRAWAEMVATAVQEAGPSMVEAVFAGNAGRLYGIAR